MVEQASELGDCAFGKLPCWRVGHVIGGIGALRWLVGAAREVEVLRSCLVPGLVRLHLYHCGTTRTSAESGGQGRLG